VDTSQGEVSQTPRRSSYATPSPWQLRGGPGRSGELPEPAEGCGPPKPVVPGPLKEESGPRACVDSPTGGNFNLIKAPLKLLKPLKGLSWQPPATPQASSAADQSLVVWARECPGRSDRSDCRGHQFDESPGIVADAMPLDDALHVRSLDSASPSPAEIARTSQGTLRDRQRLMVLRQPIDARLRLLLRLLLLHFFRGASPRQHRPIVCLMNSEISRPIVPRIAANANPTRSDRPRNEPTPITIQTHIGIFTSDAAGWLSFLRFPAFILARDRVATATLYCVGSSWPACPRWSRGDREGEPPLTLLP
jgi:hypothetical protein